MKIALTYNTSQYMYLHRRQLIQAIGDKGLDVILMSPLDDFTINLHELPARHVTISLANHGLNPLKELMILFRLYRIFRREKPFAVINSTIKLNIYGSIAAKLARVKNIYSMVNGLGYVFSGDQAVQRAMRCVIVPLYRYALNHNTRVYFQNEDDKETFSRLGIVKPECAIVINGVGVDTEHFQPSDSTAPPATFLMMARLLWDKGIQEYINAARMLKHKYPHATFLLLGPYDSNPAAIRDEQVRQWEHEAIVSYLGTTTDVRPYLAQCSVFVLPSYREGLPQSVLEAMSMGKAIITTDAPGCRETVVNGHNGFLVPVKNFRALASAMEKFILDPSLCDVFGKRSRDRAVKQFSVEHVNRAILASINT